MHTSLTTSAQHQVCEEIA